MMSCMSCPVRTSSRSVGIQYNKIIMKYFVITDKRIGNPDETNQLSEYDF